jgi:hypothetical protein
MKLEIMAYKILRQLFKDFKTKELTSEELNNGYPGIDFLSLKRQLGGEIKTSSKSIIFDIAINDLEKAKLINFGPEVPYENKPESSILIFSLVNKKEYIYLTEKGYKYYLENRSLTTKKPIEQKDYNPKNIKISGGNFYQSQIGIDNHQELNIDNSEHVIKYLTELLKTIKSTVTDKDKKDIQGLIKSAKQGNSVSNIKLFFEKLFGTAKEGIKQIAWNIISELIYRQINKG